MTRDVEASEVCGSALVHDLSAGTKVWPIYV
jgi:hypothetical protein